MPDQPVSGMDIFRGLGDVAGGVGSNMARMMGGIDFQDKGEQFAWDPGLIKFMSDAATKEESSIWTHWTYRIVRP